MKHTLKNGRLSSISIIVGTNTACTRWMDEWLAWLNLLHMGGTRKDIRDTNTWPIPLMAAFYDVIMVWYDVIT